MTEVKLNQSTLEVEVNIKAFDKEKGGLIDAIAMGSKLTKADAGRIGNFDEDETVIIIDPCENNTGCGCPKISISTRTKMTKADSGKN